MNPFKDKSMGIYIEIGKMSEANKTGYYKVYTQDFGGAEFYMSIDKTNRLIKFYLTEDFSNPVKVYDCDNKDQPIGPVPGVNINIAAKALMRALKTLDINT